MSRPTTTAKEITFPKNTKFPAELAAPKQLDFKPDEIEKNLAMCEFLLRANQGLYTKASEEAVQAALLRNQTNSQPTNRDVSLARPAASFQRKEKAAKANEAAVAGNRPENRKDNSPQRKHDLLTRVSTCINALFGGGTPIYNLRLGTRVLTPYNTAENPSVVSQVAPRLNRQ